MLPCHDRPNTMDCLTPTTRDAFALFEDTLCQGMMPTGRNEHGVIITYVTEREAQIEIAEMIMEQLRQFLAGQRGFADATAWRRGATLRRKGEGPNLKAFGVKPDFVFRPHRLAVFVDAWFWPGCPLHGRSITGDGPRRARPAP